MALSSAEEYLKTIESYLKPKPSFHIIQTGNTSKLSTQFTPILDFGNDCRYEMALQSLETYYSFPNIDEENNKMKFSLDAGATWKIIALSIGCYDITDIATEIERMVIKKGGKKGDIKIEANKNTFQCILTLKKNIEVDFKTEGTNTLRTVLGFDEKIYKVGRNESEHVVQIMRVNSILVYCDVIGSSYLNETMKPIVFSFFPDASPGDKIVCHPTTLMYLPVTMSLISRMTCYLTDQTGRLLDLRGEELTLKFHIKAC